MNRLELLKEIYEMTSHNLLCYSQDCLMSKPKDEFISEWKNEKEKISLLNEMIKEEEEKQEEMKNNFNTNIKKIKEIGECEEFEW